MKKFALLLILFVLGSCSLLDSSRSNNSLFYYHFSEKVYLNVNKKLLFVSFDHAQSCSNFISNLNAIPSLKVWNSDNPYFMQHGHTNNLVVESKKNKISDDIISSINHRPDVQYLSPVVDKQGELIFVSNQFSVKLKSDQDFNKLENLVRDTNCKLENCDYAPNGVYYVKCLKESKLNAIQMSVLYYETDLFDYCSPHFMYPISTFVQ